MKTTTVPLLSRQSHQVHKNAAAETPPTITIKNSVGSKSSRRCFCYWTEAQQSCRCVATSSNAQKRQQQQQHSYYYHHDCRHLQQQHQQQHQQQQPQQRHQEPNDEHHDECRTYNLRERRRYAQYMVMPSPPTTTALAPTLHSADALRAAELRNETALLVPSTPAILATNVSSTDARLCHAISEHERECGGSDPDDLHRVVAAVDGATDRSAKASRTDKFCLNDSIKIRLTLRKPQLVMPIPEKTSSSSSGGSRSSSVYNVTSRVRGFLWWTRLLLPIAQSLTTSLTLDEDENDDEEQVDEVEEVEEVEEEENGEVSETTTMLECTMCFKVNGDILSELEAKAVDVTPMTATRAAAQAQWRGGVPAIAAATATVKRKWEPLQKCWRSLLSSTCSSWLFLVLLLVLTTSSTVDCWAGRQDSMSNCTFPVRWEGSWFLSGYQQSIHIKGSQFSYRGRCAASDGNKFLIIDEKGCHRCLVIYEKHKNVLQYKESECEGDSMYMHQSNPSAMAMHSVIKQNLNGGDHRGGAHPNTNNNGHSRLSSSDQYIMRSNDDMNDYFCKGRETLQNLCDQIPGDALLYSLFRESAEAVKCPLKGPFIFTYNRGHGECKNPVSNIESCTEDSRLLLSFQACHDVLGTESTVEELTCLAAWKDGNSRYLVGLVSHHHAISNEERYRCFVYEKISQMGNQMGVPSTVVATDAEYKLAQSGDATCNGLDSAEVGSRIMSLRKPPITERCDFPVWFKGPRNWQALMGNAYYNYHSNDGSVHMFNSNGYMETRALCEQINKQTATEMMAVVHYTTGCKSGFMCLMFYRRDTHVIEIQSGKQAARLEDACAPDHFDINKTPYLTLLASNPDPQICPLEGLYSLRGAIGPPYQATRHKRNHNNNKAPHSGHGHHLSDGFVDAAMGNSVAHKRYNNLRFRNAEAHNRSPWYSNTRGLPIRRRRDAANGTQASLNSGNGTVSLPTHQILLADNASAVMSPAATAAERQRRHRRNVPACVTNYKAQRQLWVGCTEPNVIDVRPLCNEDGDEEYSCHGSWAENGTVYIIARHKGVNKHGVCISYRSTEGTSAMLVVGDACFRNSQKPPDHHLVANLAVFGKCGETHPASGQGKLKPTSGLALIAVMISALLLRVWQTLGGHHRSR